MKKRELRERIAELEAELADARDEAKKWQRMHQGVPYVIPVAPPTWTKWPPPLGPTTCQMTTVGV